MKILCFIVAVCILDLSVRCALISWQCEVADDEPLPAVEGLQISGEAFPGQELKASGYSINGTTSCNFEVWHTTGLEFCSLLFFFFNC